MYRRPKKRKKKVEYTVKRATVFRTKLSAPCGRESARGEENLSSRRKITLPESPTDEAMLMLRGP